MKPSSKIPRDPEDDYQIDIIRKRQEFIAKETEVNLNHSTRFSFDPHEMTGNIENFWGVAQVPLGIAGPLMVNGEHANGEFLIPLATIEGSLLASYNRGMKVIRESGGVTTTISAESMQRAPVFVFKDARQARDFQIWLNEHFQEIKTIAEASTKIGVLHEIENYQVHSMVFTRFNYSTGDAAGQNMVSRATFIACEWITKQRLEMLHYLLSGNFDTEKKTSSVNLLKGRGKRVTAEITVPRETLIKHLRITPEQIAYGHQVSTLSALLTNSSNNANHPANGLAALYLATGQDMANIGESNQCTTYQRATSNGDFYFSITLPALIVATYGGGTSLPTQRECLRILGCEGKGKALKLCEIAAAVVVAGELSLSGAARVDKRTRENEWIDAHERLGRNR